ncbi:MAG: gliding motility-associated C-terminal domain-containing protein [Bacteroidia bacterium]
MLRLRFSYCSILLLIASATFGQNGFTENKGQFDDQVSYQADLGQFKVFLDDSGFTLLLHDEKVWGEIAEEFHDYFHYKKLSSTKPKVLGFQSVKYKLLNANWSQSIGVDAFETRYNYYLGSDSSHWASDVRRFQKVTFKDIYPNIDIEFLALDKRFKYNFILNPGADISDIKLAIEGADYEVKKNRIVLNTRFGTLDDVLPVSYWVNEGGEEPAEVWYEVVDGVIKFRKLRSKKSSTLVIDPELIFSTYSGSSLDNFGFTATYDEDGNLYSGGIALSPNSWDLRSRGSYPTTIGAFDEIFDGGDRSGFIGNNSPCDIAINKYSSDGSKLLYATFLGGEKNEFPHSLIVDKEGNLIVFGTTFSYDYPTTSTAFRTEKQDSLFIQDTIEFYDTTYLFDDVIDFIDTIQYINERFDTENSKSEIFVTKLNRSGSNLVGSTYFGGSQDDGHNSAHGITRDFYADEFRGEVNIDSNDLIYVSSSTYSDDIPTTSGSFQKDYLGKQDGVIFCLNKDLSNLEWCSYFGGAENDALFSIDFSKDFSSLYVSGCTNSGSLPSTTGAHSSDTLGMTDGLISKINLDGSTVQNTTYVGTPRKDQVMGVETDKNDFVYVVGQTSGPFPIKGSVYNNSNSGQFLVKYKSDLSETVWSTTFGSQKRRPDITVNAFLVDECGKLFVSGWGGNTDELGFSLFNTELSNMPLTSDAVQRTTDGNDFYIAVFDEDAKKLIYGTYFGGDKTNDHVDGGTSRFDKRGVIYQSVCSSCPTDQSGYYSSDFPTSDGAYAEKNKSYRCSNASFKFAAINFNAPPNMKDTLYEVIATEDLSFTYEITDPDEDTILVNFAIQDSDKPYFVNPPAFIRSVVSLQSDFEFKPTCDRIGDTIKIDVVASDIGCPNTADSNGTITIVVLPPPVLNPPEVICLFFTPTDEIRLEWVSLSSNDYFKRMYLHKRWPDGREEIIDTFYSTGAGTYLDTDVINPRNSNYTYFMSVENICDLLGPFSYEVGTTKESEVPVESTYLKTVTVEGDSLRIIWMKSREDDFLEYVLLKSIRGEDNFIRYQFIDNVNDTVFVDKAVDVNNVSYCYKIQVIDNCGNTSAFSNLGCSIVIEGEALNEEGVTPRFKFDLEWDDYVEWQGGVYEYELIRSVDTGVLRPLVSIPITDYLDSDLDFDWGGYWYSVIAHEGVGGYNASSRSNDIYLIQPPLVFVPNAVTANGDNLNDVFGWSDVFVLDFEMKVYNRWGEKVFESTDKNSKWDGVFKGEEMDNSNVYFWIVTYTGWDRSRHISKGTVTILK